MTTYDLRLSVVREFGDPLDETYNFHHRIEMPRNELLRMTPNDLQRLFTRRLHDSLDLIIDEATRVQADVRLNAPPATRGDTLHHDDIMRALANTDRLVREDYERLYQGTFRPEEGAVVAMPRNHGRTNRFMEQMIQRGRDIFQRTGRMPTFVAADDATARARFEDFTDAIQFAHPPAASRSVRPRPPASHALWPLTPPTP